MANEPVIPKPIIKLSDKVRQTLNQLLADSRTLLAEATKQESAGVPGMDALVQRCENCIQQIEQFKAVNFPGRK